MPTPIEVLQLALDASGMEKGATQAQQALDKVVKSSKGASDAVADVEKKLDETSKTTTVTTTSMKTLVDSTEAASQATEKFGERIKKTHTVAELLTTKLGHVGKAALGIFTLDVIAQVAGFNGVMDALHEVSGLVAEGIREVGLELVGLSKAEREAANEAKEASKALDDLYAKRRKQSGAIDLKIPGVTSTVYAPASEGIKQEIEVAQLVAKAKADIAGVLRKDSEDFGGVFQAVKDLQDALDKLGESRKEAFYDNPSAEDFLKGLRLEREEIEKAWYAQEKLVTARRQAYDDEKAHLEALKPYAQLGLLGATLARHQGFVVAHKQDVYEAQEKDALEAFRERKRVLDRQKTDEENDKRRAQEEADKAFYEEGRSQLIAAAAGSRYGNDSPEQLANKRLLGTIKLAVDAVGDGITEGLITRDWSRVGQSVAVQVESAIIDAFISTPLKNALGSILQSAAFGGIVGPNGGTGDVYGPQFEPHAMGGTVYGPHWLVPVNGRGRRHLVGEAGAEDIRPVSQRRSGGGGNTFVINNYNGGIGSRGRESSMRLSTRHQIEDIQRSRF